MDLLKNISIDKIRNAAEDAINQAKPKTDVEARVFEALSHKNWGSSSTLMNEIARDTFDYDKFSTITKIVWDSLANPRPAAWRVVFKGLTLLEHMIKNGSERVIDDTRNHSHVLRALYNFNYYEGAVDRGQGVREKSKQVVELVGDDERLREERTKAKQLREKFGASIGSIGNGGGGGGGGGSSYAGYGNDDSKFSGYNGGGGGYGNSGIGASGGFSDSGIGSSGGFSDSQSNNTSGFSGRYSEDNAAPDAAPTFATIPEKEKKKKKKKSKKKKDKTLDAVAPATPSREVAPPVDDLFDMSNPAPAADTFNAFESAPADTPTSGGFDAFQSAPAPAPSANTFDAFGATSSNGQNQQSSQFDAFSGNSNTMQTQQQGQGQFDAFGNSGMNATNNTMNNNMNAMNNNTNAMNNNMNAMNNNMNNNGMMNMQQQFGNMNMAMQQQQMMMGGSQSNAMGGNQSNMMGGSQSNVMGGSISKPSADDDDFGDFDDGNTGKSTATNSDPLGGLISLDGLTKNKKKEDRTKAPIAFNDAAKSFISNSNSGMHQPPGSSKISVDLAFSGVDGLQKQSFMSMNNNAANRLQPGQSVMNAPNMGMMQQGMGMNNTNNMNMMNNNNGMSMGGNNMQRNMMGNSQQGNMMGGRGGNNNMGMGGMMGNNNMGMGGMMGNNNNNNGMGQQGNMMGGMANNNNAMGGMGMGGMANNNSNTMGGQPMGGWQ